jgi:DNA-binding CsgD family transcriptional regulator
VEIGRLGQAGYAEILLADHALICDGPQALVEPAAALAETGAVLRLPIFSFFSEVLLATRDALTGDTKAMAERISRFGDLTRLPPDFQSYPQAIQAMAAVMAGDLAEAQRLLDAAAVPLLEHDSAAPLLHYGLWAVVSARTAGPDEVARAELRRRPGQLRPAHRGALAYADAIVAGRQGDLEAAVHAYAAGDELLARVPWWHRFLRLLTLEAAIPDGWGTPVPVLRGDLATYEEAGETSLARICRDLLRRAGAPTRRGRGDSAVPPALRSLGVTSREVDVLRLIAGGLTNSAISERLFLSPRTVETHVTSLLIKSGTTNRQELRDWFRALTP